MKIVLIISIIVGIINGYCAIYGVKNGFLKGVKPSNSLIEFIFLNR